jgi:putative zinc finger/helix-turn-helix YgiT family protein
VPVDYNAEYFYCGQTDETWAGEQQISASDISMKNAYRKKMGLLTSQQILALRARYGISQSDLCLLLGWGAKTITRYESHQVQDAAHDTILRKLDSDPEWFLDLLDKGRQLLSEASYEKYRETGIMLFGKEHDSYLKSAVMSGYARFRCDPESTGGKDLSLNAAADMIRCFASSSKVTGLLRVKLMNLMWYADALSYKRRGHSISGLVYRALPKGAVPVAFESIAALSGIPCEEMGMGDGSGYIFLPAENKDYYYLTAEDKDILDAVIRRFGKTPGNRLVEMMHMEDAYRKTAPNDIIRFKYAQTLSLS